MKKILTHLTGIVFLLTILLAGACNSDKKHKGTEPEESSSEQAGQIMEAANLDKPVEIYLREIKIAGSMHLLMSDSRKPDVEVIDGLITDVKRGDIVVFMKGKQSKIESVDTIRLVGVEGDPKIYQEKIEAEYLKYYELTIDSNALPNDTLVKYEIEFKVDGDTYIIDPYLKLPKQTIE